MQEVAGEQGTAYIPMLKGRGFTLHFDKQSPVCISRRGIFQSLILLLI